MIEITEAFSFIPRDFTPRIAVKIQRADGTLDTVTGDVYSGEFVSQATIGLGNFKMSIVNTGGKNYNKWNKGDTVFFYGDLDSGTTLQFKGRIDFPKDDLKGDGQFLNFEGRHISYLALETYVSKSYTNQDGAVVLKDMIDSFLAGSGFTYANVPATIGTNVTYTWDNKPFWECVRDILIDCGADCYIDDNLDFHLFLANSIVQTKDAVWRGYNLIGGVKGFGVDSYYEKTKVRVIGKDDSGLPVIATKGTGARTKPILDYNIKTLAEATTRAEKEYNAVSAAPTQGSTESYGLPNLKPGENIVVSSMEQQVFAFYKAIEIKHKIGVKNGMWTTELKLEKEEYGTGELLRERARGEMKIQTANNPNAMEYSKIISFADSSMMSSLVNVRVSNSRLTISSGSSGTGTSVSIASEINASRMEVRVIGSDLAISTYRVSANGGTSWTSAAASTAVSVSGGTVMVAEITLLASPEYPNPSLERVGIYWSA